MDAGVLTFSKYQATGNDFVLVDDRTETFPVDNKAFIARLCHRRFGIGADGLILLRNDTSSDFRMIYFNADGAEGSLCGNGSRCVVAFAKHLGIIGDSCNFQAIDGMHEATITGEAVRLKMGNVSEIREKEQYSFLDTGSPHHVQEVEDLPGLDVPVEGKRLRYSLYGEKGSNINFVRVTEPDRVSVRTYERGVEDETFSCGTGVTAVALALHRKGRLGEQRIAVDTAGGELQVEFNNDQHGGYSNIWLSGPARKVYEGTWQLRNQ
ncbi:diaminopimelate epimerase [Robiginitalea myxolifaciens]|uniref:Diaminopimelate epimerase n=1 Tax=Robiginitalea myxolifaciens TaxID=400055 RepID=A0A1I6GRL9_9FLAO|nr:diaminopimelate epimerase [Robiginitalea myxolifaciens]SFR44852.1 diaminopimelate epimerase [Robiginitalea myxolifaciens]